MRHISHFFACLSALLCLQASAQSRLINTGWSFARLSGGTTTWDAAGQGATWQSQFNVEHRSGTSTPTALHPDTVAREFALLGRVPWETVTLPHTAYVEPLVIRHPRQGVCYYRRALRVTAEEAAGTVWIEFEGAMQLADIWINGRHVMQHAGGFTTFVVDATGLLKPDSDNELLVRLDNRDNPLIPPGKPLATLDFCYHSGIYRDVRLITRPPVHITHPLLSRQAAGGGIFVTYPRVSEQQAAVRVKTEVANDASQRRHVVLTHTLRPRRGAKAAGRAVAVTVAEMDIDAGEQHTAVAEMEVEHPQLWSPDDPRLYDLETVVRVEGRVVDRRVTRIGIRRFEVSRERGCLINGRPVRLVGTNRHMEYPYVGNALSDAAQRRDIRQIRDNGFNIVRLGHYPQDPAVLDACDEMGLLAIEPIPGWQFFNRDSTFTRLTYENIRELIRRDRNHPSILLWETTLNESWPPAEWKDSAVAVAHAEMPEGECYTSGDMYGYHGFDVCYNDWRDADRSRPNDGPKPGFIREYYDYEFGGHYSTTRIGRRDGQAALMQNLWNAQWSHNRHRAAYPQTMGDAVWSMYDYNRGCADNICESGVADIFRLPKYSLAFYRTQRPAGSYTTRGAAPYEVFIASRWEADGGDTLVVMGNVDEVELRLNGKTIARRRADSGPSTAYVPRHDGGNCRHLAFPPFTFPDIRWEKGRLEAIGYHRGRQVAATAVRTPEAPCDISLSLFESGERATSDDVLLVYATLCDRHGTPCSDNDVPVSLTVAGGTLLSPSEVTTAGGTATFLVRTNGAKHLGLSAVSGEMKAKRRFRLKRAE